MSCLIAKKSDVIPDFSTPGKTHSAGRKAGAKKSRQFSAKWDVRPASVEPAVSSCLQPFFTEAKGRGSRDYFGDDSHSRTTNQPKKRLSQYPPPCNKKIISEFNNKNSGKTIEDVICCTSKSIMGCDNMNNALTLLNNLDDISSEAGKSSQLDAGVFNAYLTKAKICCQTRWLQSELDQALRMMQRRNVIPNACTCVCMLNIYKKIKDINSARLIVFGDGNQQSLIKELRLTEDEDIRIYSALLGVCAATKNKEVTEQVLELFAKNVAANDAEREHRFPVPNEGACVCLLTAFESYGDIDSAQRLVFGDDVQSSLLKQWGVAETIKIYNALLGVCAAAKNKEVTERVLAVLIENVAAHANKQGGAQRHPQPNQRTCVCLLTAFASYGDINNAVRLVLFSYGGELSLIMRWGLTANTQIYNALLGVSAATGDKTTALRVLAVFIENVAANANKKEGAQCYPVPDRISCICLLTAFASYGDIDSAELVVFGDGKQPSLLKRWWLKETTEILNALLGVCAATKNKKATERVLALFIRNVAANKKERAQRHPRPNERTCVCLLMAFASYQDIDSAELVVFGDGKQSSLLKRWGLTGTIRIYNALLSVCAVTKNKKVTEQVLAVLIENAAANADKENGDRHHPVPVPDEITCVGLLSAFASYGDINNAVRLVLFSYGGRLSLIERWGLTATTEIYNALLGVCAATGDKIATQRVLAVFIKNVAANKKERAQRHPVPDTIFCICLLNAFASYGDIDSAQRVAFGNGKQPSLLEQWELTETTKIYCALLGVCAATKNKEVTEQVLELFIKNVAANKKNGVQRHPLPDETACVCLLTAFESYGDIDSAQRLVFGDDVQSSLLKQWGVAETIKIYNSLLGVCAAAKNKEVTERVLALFIRIIAANANKKEGARCHPVPERISCICLLTAFASYGDIDSAELLVFGDGKQPSLLKQWGIKETTEILNALLGVCAAAKNKKVTERVLEVFIRNAAANKKEGAKRHPVPDKIACSCLLIAFASYLDTVSAARLVFGDGERRSYLSRWGIRPSPQIYAYWALVDPDNFDQRILELTESNICHQNLGLTDNILNCHSKSIFNEPVETSTGVPFEFAKALYEYHLNRNQSGNTIEIVTGHNSEDKLKSQFISYFREKGVNVRSNPGNPGILLSGT